MSSTYADLQKERDVVFQTLMKMDCIPAGMELFPAIDEEQFEFIKKVIDDCDYYILIIGGRYGSLTPEGISYTKKEYDYAMQRGIKVIAFLHENPDNLTVAKSEIDGTLRQKLLEFRNEVSKGRLVRFWKSAEELPGLVALNLPQTIKAYPAVGWVRANQIPTTELLTEINDVRKRNAELEREINELRDKDSSVVQNLAPFDDAFQVYGTSWYNRQEDPSFRSGNWSLSITWKEIFLLISPYLLNSPDDEDTKSTLELNFRAVYKNRSDPAMHDIRRFNLDDQVYQTIKIQFIAFGLVTISDSNWSLTPKGQALMLEVRSIKSDS